MNLASLTISSATSTALVASTGTFQLLPVASMASSLTPEFWNLEAPVQSNILHSACHYLEPFMGADDALLASVRNEMIPELGKNAEPSTSDILRFSRVMSAWTMHQHKIEGESATQTRDAYRPAASSAAPAVHRERSAEPLFQPSPFAASALEGDGDRASMGGLDEAEERLLYPSFWWDHFKQSTRWDLKFIALSTEGKTIKEKTHDDETHAQFLSSALAKAAVRVRDLLTEAGTEKLAPPVVRRVQDHLSTISNVLTVFRREDIRATPLGQAFWKDLSRNSELRLANTRLITSRLQAVLEDEVKAQLNATVVQAELGIMEFLVAPLYEGQQSANPLDEQHGAAMARKFSDHMKALPMIVKELNEDQEAALSLADSVLRTVGEKIRGNPDSAFALAFFRDLGGEVIQFVAVVEMIQRKRAKERAASQALVDQPET